MKNISKITVNNNLYQIRDDRALHNPEVEGVEGQVLTYTDQGIVWDNPSAANNVTSDYTAFEVFAHDYDIPVGECEELGGYVSNIIPASMTHNFVLRTMCQDYTKSDVVIDWGDGTTSTIAKGEYNKDPENADASADVSNGEANYAFSHTYTENGKYIVKIYGKQYYNICNEIRPAGGYDTYICSSLICRVFDSDLPLASHLNNLSLMCAYSNALLYVNADGIKYQYYINIAGIFRLCKNLLEIKGFKRNFINASCANALSSCSSLKKTDLQLPLKSLYSTACQETYAGCENLEVDINSLIPDTQGVYLSNFSMDDTFLDCKKLYGTVPAEKLWNNKYVKWNATAYTFARCSDEIRAQVPVSWGGTNKLIDAEITLNKLNVDKNDYTAFEVFAHNYDIPVGECEELGGYVSKLIPASMTHNFVLRTMCRDYTKSDVVIDWGDGETSIIAEGQYNKDPENADVSADTANGEANYAFSHTYAENGKYIVKIYGKQYYNINNVITPTSGYDKILSSLICRAFDFDLPLALHLNNLSCTCAYSNALLYVNAANIKYRYFINASQIFAECRNLLEAVEFKRNFINANCHSAHQGNVSLRKTDMQIPFKSLYPGAAHQQYLNCWNLEVDIASLFPEVQGLVNCNFSFYRTFYECKKLYGTVPANKLWNNKYLNVQAEPTSQTFKDCPAEILAQVPVSWGGTASDDIIDKSDIGEASSRGLTFIYFDVPDESQINAGDRLLLEIDFDNADDFSSKVSFSQADCQLFNPATGNWISIPQDGIDLAMASSKLRFPMPEISYSNCRYRWKVVDGTVGSYCTAII